ncbi:laminin G domain-containing protein [Dactylosporangium sp. CA-092794]|uniref:laminin G domain-containing protein n=1 Tax=Dactylosporangium sp. CA-092794 TaxID=3239929 RepID=UPI003D92FF14
MRSPGRFAIAFSATAVLVAGEAWTSGATAAVAETDGGHVIARYDMNESGGTRTMTDTSGHGLDGTVGSEVLTGVNGAGATGYRFTRLQPDTPPTHPWHLATVPSAADLNPGDRDYAVTVRLRTQYHFGNIVQKGQATVEGGNFKLQIPNGIVQCLFRGDRGTVIVSSRSRLNDGAWHTVRCERTGTGLALTVDGTVEARRAGRTGYIANAWPLSIGGKTACDQIDVGCDYYAGDLDYVQLEARD